MAESVLDEVEPPTMKSVGGNDTQVLGLNREALAQLETEKELKVVSGAGHLFEEPGALDEVAEMARDWFKRHLEG
jgi:alpha-beta hydrolase superfamily lysophospholipase